MQSSIFDRGPLGPRFAMNAWWSHSGPTPESRSHVEIPEKFVMRSFYSEIYGSNVSGPGPLFRALIFFEPSDLVVYKELSNHQLLTCPSLWCTLNSRDVKAPLGS